MGGGAGRAPLRVGTARAEGERPRREGDGVVRLPAPTGGRPTPFGHANLLVAPSVAEGCSGEAHGVLAEAFRVRDVSAIERESARLAGAYAQARAYLVAAEWILRGKGEAATRGR